MNAETLMEEQFFLTATNKARRWVTELKLHAEDGNALDSFLAAFEPSKLVRDKREHDEEYFGSKGKPEILSDATAPGSSLALNVGQSVTVHRDGRHLLGGKYDVEKWNSRRSNTRRPSSSLAT